MKATTKSKFDKVTSKGLVMVYFWADWCGPCKFMKPVMEELCEKYRGKVSVVSLNVDKAPKIVNDLKIHSVPTVYLFEDGIVKERSIGATTLLSLEEMFRGL